MSRRSRFAKRRSPRWRANEERALIMARVLAMLPLPESAWGGVLSITFRPTYERDGMSVAVGTRRTASGAKVAAQAFVVTDAIGYVTGMLQEELQRQLDIFVAKRIVSGRPL